MLFDYLKRFFQFNKVILLFIVSFILIGFFTGVFSAIKQIQNFSLNLLQNVALRKFLLKDYGYIGFTFISLLFNFLLTIICFALCYFKAGKWVLFPFFVYLAYLVGIDFVIIYKCLGVVKGGIVAIVAYSIWRFIVLVLFSLFIFRLSFYNKEVYCFGKSSMPKANINIGFTYLILTSVAIIIQSFILLILVKLFVFI